MTCASQSPDNRRPQLHLRPSARVRTWCRSCISADPLIPTPVHPFALRSTSGVTESSEQIPDTGQTCGIQHVATPIQNQVRTTVMTAAGAERFVEVRSSKSEARSWAHRTRVQVRRHAFGQWPLLRACMLQPALLLMPAAGDLRPFHASIPTPKRRRPRRVGNGLASASASASASAPGIRKRLAHNHLLRAWCVPVRASAVCAPIARTPRRSAIFDIDVGYWILRGASWRLRLGSRSGWRSGSPPGVADSSC
ncbi:hypothetical protein C8Q70DRAFT_119157 [Cubamyces menziesii]|nr:hypothetical protein C8Q70DRAFT_119157 [Cubamyces menziesii]